MHESIPISAEFTKNDIIIVLTTDGRPGQTIRSDVLSYIAWIDIRSLQFRTHKLKNVVKRKYSLRYLSQIRIPFIWKSLFQPFVERNVLGKSLIEAKRTFEGRKQKSMKFKFRKYWRQEQHFCTAELRIIWCTYFGQPMGSSFLSVISEGVLSSVHY